MKGIPLILAIVLGVIGALCNYVYLDNKLPEMELVSFVAIAPGQEVERGDVLREEHLVRVDIPRKHVGNLDQVAVLYSAIASVKDQPVWRRLEGGWLVLTEDVKTPPPQLHLASDEGIVWIPVDTRSMIPSLIEPGDRVTFLISQARSMFPTPAAEFDPSQPQPDAELEPSGPMEPVGPFTVLSLGNRLGSSAVHKSARMPQVQENVIGIRVELDREGKLMPHVQHLLDLLDATGNRPVGVMLHGQDDSTD